MSRFFLQWDIGFIKQGWHFAYRCTRTRHGHLKCKTNQVLVIERHNREWHTRPASSAYNKVQVNKKFDNSPHWIWIWTCEWTLTIALTGSLDMWTNIDNSPHWIWTCEQTLTIALTGFGHVNKHWPYPSLDLDMWTNIGNSPLWIWTCEQTLTIALTGFGHVNKHWH